MIMGILNNLLGKNEEKENNFFLTPDGRKWGVNVDRLVEKCLTSDNEKSKDTEITEGFEKNDEGDMIPTSKIIREVNSQGNMQNDTIRYDLIKTLLSVVLDKRMMNFGNIEKEMEYDLSFNIAFNTLVNEGIIYEITQ